MAVPLRITLCGPDRNGFWIRVPAGFVVAVNIMLERMLERAGWR